MRPAFSFGELQGVSPGWDVWKEPADEDGRWQCLQRRRYIKAKMPMEKFRADVKRGRRRQKERTLEHLRDGIFILSRAGSSKAVSGCESASTGASWTLSCAKKDLVEQARTVRWKAVRLPGRRELVVHGQRPFAL